MTKINLQGKQNGAALVVGLVLLVVVTVLAVSGMNTATTELAMARNNQNYENAFQAAETGLEQALAQGRFNTLAAVNLVQNVNANDSVTSTISLKIRHWCRTVHSALALAAALRPIIFLRRQPQIRNARASLAQQPIVTHRPYIHRLFTSLARNCQHSN